MIVNLIKNFLRRLYIFKMIIIDNFIQDKKIFTEIQKEETWSNLPTYNWWDGWWKCKPRNIMETLIELIWKRLNIENKIA